MTPAFELDSFEYVEAGPGLALVRLAGTWAAGNPAEVSLFSVADGERTALPSLPAPPSDGDVWRGAFSGTPELVRDASVRFELEAPGAGVVELPLPVEHGAAAVSEPAPVAEPQAAVAEPQAAAEPVRPQLPQREAPFPRLFGRRRMPAAAPAPVTDASLRQELAAERAARQAAEHAAAYQRERAEEAEAILREQLAGTLGQAAEVLERVDGYERHRVSFEQELAAIRDAHEARLAALGEELDEARAELSTTIYELNSAHELLDTAHEAHSLELKAARSQRDAANERQRAVEEQLVATQADVETLRAELEDRRELIERARAEAALANEQAAEMQASAERLRDAITVRVREAERRQTRRFGRGDQQPQIDPDALAAAREELREGLERLAALEDQAEALREGIREQLHGGGQSPLQEALPLEVVAPPQS
jgi:hypothetical protein